MPSPSVLIAACSPRKNGNSDIAARILQESFSVPCAARRIADAGIRPCQSCGHCRAHPGSCALDRDGDGAAGIFSLLMRARLAVLVSPIYFYHLPAQAKALIDRTQRFWHLEPQARPLGKTALTAVLLAGRPSGEKLFEGAERTLRYMALSSGMDWIPALCLYGLDEPGALAGDAGSMGRIRQFAQSLERGMAGK